MAILLADPDFRIRRTRGQTKVTFRGESATAVAESHVGIGDTLRLSLRGAQWARSADDISTIGERADWDLEYAEEVFMEVYRSTIPLAVIDVTPPPRHIKSPLNQLDVNEGTKTTKPRTGRDQELWASPAFTKRKSHLSNPLAEITVNSLVEEDEDIPGRARKRTRFSRKSSSWRYLERKSGSHDENHTVDNTGQVSSIQDIAASTFESFQLNHEDEEVDSWDGRASEQLGPQTRREDNAADYSEEIPPKTLLPPPSPSMKLRQHAGDSSITPLEVEIDETFLLDLENHRQALPIATPFRATNSRLLPTASLELPLISPVGKRDAAVAGDFQPTSNALLKLDSSAAMHSQDLSERTESDEASPPIESGVSVHQTAEKLAEDAEAVTTLRSACQTIDLTSPSVDDEELQRKERNRDLQVKIPTSGHHTPNAEQTADLRDAFEVPNEISVEVRPVNAMLKYALDHRSQGIADATLLELSARTAFASTTFTQTVPPSPGKVDEESKDAVPEFADRIASIPPPPQQPPSLSTDHFDDTSDLHLSGGKVSAEREAVEQEDDKQHYILPCSLIPSQRHLHWIEGLEVSAREVEGYDLPISTPPFPFKQGWDTKARKEIKAHQAQRTLAASRLYMSGRDSYDGAEDRVRSPSGEPPEAMSYPESERRSLFYDDDRSLIREEVRKPEEKSETGVGGFALLPRSQSTSSRTVDKDVQITQVAELKLVGKDMPPTTESYMGHGIVLPSNSADTEVEIFSRSAESDVRLTDDGFGAHSSPALEEGGYLQRPSETLLSRSPSLVPDEDTDTCSISMTPMPCPPLLARIDDNAAAQIDVSNAESSGRHFSSQSGRLASRADQLTTPDNSQQGVQNSQVRDLQDKSRVEKSGVEVPPSPPKTQDLQDLQHIQGTQAITSEEPSDAKEELLGLSEDRGVSPASSDLDETDVSEKPATPSPDRTRCRRSSRLSGKMPLLGKDPSEIISPYFTSRRSSQYHEPSPPLHRPLSQDTKPRDNVVVLIPPPINKCSLYVQEPAASVTSTSTSSLSPIRQAHGKGFTTPISYFPSLASIPAHFNDQIDILAVIVAASKQPQRAKSGPRDYCISLKVADFSCDDGIALSIQLFRPYKNALPACARGDVILLRCMKVQTCRTLSTPESSQRNKALDGMILVSTENSAWAVFNLPLADSISATEARPGSSDGFSQPPAKRSTGIKMDVQINGPPVELGSEEKAFARGLIKWWVEEGEAIFPDEKSKSWRKSKGKDKVDELAVEEGNLHEHELRDGMTYRDMLSPRHEQLHTDGKIHLGDAEGSLYEHELRDGTAYGDTISQVPLHEHQHHNLDHADTHDLITSGHRESVNEGEATLHEHELRDGMAYGDTISPLPLHQHFHHEDNPSS